MRYIKSRDRMKLQNQMSRVQILVLLLICCAVLGQVTYLSASGPSAVQGAHTCQVPCTAVTMSAAVILAPAEGGISICNPETASPDLSKASSLRKHFPI